MHAHRTLLLVGALIVALVVGATLAGGGTAPSPVPSPSAVEALSAGPTPAPSRSPGTAASAGPAPPASADAAAVLDRLLGDGMDAGTLRCLAGGIGPDQAPPIAPTDMPTALPDVVARISSQLEQVRDLRFDHPVDAQLDDPAQVAARIGQLFDQEYDPVDADTDARLLSTLGAVPPSTDVRATRRKMLGDQVAGFYVPETGELVVRSVPGKPLGATDRVTLAHELDHALADQRLTLPDTSTMDADAALAATAVVEGDATLAMTRWSQQHLSLLEQLGMLAATPELAAAAQDLDQVPHYLAQELMFPYTAGLSYTCRAWEQGGWQAVDDLYADPPATTAAVLFPDLFAATDSPRLPDRLTLTTPDWRRRHDDTFGAAELLWLLQAPGNDTARAVDDARGRARAWAGGRMAIWTHDEDTAVGIALTDGATGSSPLCTTMKDWYAAAFPTAARAGTTDGAWFDGTDQDAAIRCTGNQVRVGIAPDLATAQDIVQ